MTFTRPYFGTASSMSKTFAVSTYSGGSSSSVVDRHAAGLQVALELGAPGPDLVRALEGVHPLDEGALGRRRGAWRAYSVGRRHGRRVYIFDAAAGKPKRREFALTST